MDILIAVVVIILISGYKSKVSSNRSKNKKRKQYSSFEDIKKEFTKYNDLTNNNTKKESTVQSNANQKIKRSREISKNKIDSIGISTQKNIDEIIYDDNNKNYDETYISSVENIVLNTEYLNEIRDGFKHDGRRAFIYSEIFNRKY